MLNLHIRKATIADVPALAMVHVDTWKGTYKGIISDAIIQNLTYETGENRFLAVIKMQNDEVTCIVAELEQGEIVGFAIGGKERSGHPRYKGELWGIYVGREYQRRGIGKRLVSIILQKLFKLNINSMLVWVLKDNPYRKFYESLGGHYIDEKMVTMGAEDLIEVAYGWENLRELHKLLEK